MEDKKPISSFLPFYALPLMAGGLQSAAHSRTFDRGVGDTGDRLFAQKTKIFGQNRALFVTGKFSFSQKGFQ